MNKVLLYDIPIYSTSEEVFKKKFKIKMNKITEEFPAHKWNRNEAYSVVKKLNINYITWKYNNVIGWINITINKSDIKFELYKSNCKRHYALTNVKHYLECMQLNGMHFRIDKLDTNQEINEKIMTYIIEIKDKHFDKNTVIDLESYNTLSPFIDYKQISTASNTPFPSLR